MGCGRDDKLVKSCARGDKNNRATDYGQKSVFLRPFPPFPHVIHSHKNKNLSTTAAKTLQAAVEIRFSETTELDSPLSLSLSLSLSLWGTALGLRVLLPALSGRRRHAAHLAPPPEPVSTSRFLPRTTRPAGGAALWLAATRRGASACSMLDEQ